MPFLNGSDGTFRMPDSYYDPPDDVEDEEDDDKGDREYDAGKDA